MLHNNTFTFKKINKIASMAKNKETETQKSAVTSRAECFSLLTGVYLDTVDGANAGAADRERQELQRRHGVRRSFREGTRG